METDKTLYRLKVQVAILREIQEEYGHCTIANTIQQIDSRIKHLEENGN